MKLIKAKVGIPHVLTQFEETASKLETIPTVPVIAQKLMGITASPDFSMAQVERLIASDQAIAVRLMRVASSATFSPRAVTSVRGALVRIGMQNVRKLILAAAVIGDRLTALHKAVWVHSLRVGSIAEVLAERLPAAMEDPFICGLLHDFGIVALDRVLGADYRNVVADPGTDEHLASERSAFAFDHGDMGAILARQWNLFPTLCAIMQLHHEPLDAREVVSDDDAMAIYCISLSRHMVLDPQRLDTHRECRELCRRLGVSSQAVNAAATLGERNFIERYAALLT